MKKIPILKVDSIEDPFIVGIKNPYIIIPNIDEETKKIDSCMKWDITLKEIYF